MTPQGKAHSLALVKPMHTGLAMTPNSNDRDIAMYAHDSMEPSIYSGDSLVIDKTMNSVTSDGGIYVLNYDGELFVKRVQKQLNGTVAITSDNKNYGDIVIPSTDLNTLHVIGRVVWSGHPMI